MKYPELSFGNKNHAWMAISFGAAFEFLNNKAISRSQLNYDEGEVKSVHYGDILTKFPQVLDSAYPSLPYVNDEIDVSKVSLLKTGDVAIADTAEDYMVGKAIEISISDDSQLIAGLHVMACRPKINFAPGFLGYYLNSNAFHVQLRKLVTGTKVFAINKSEIRKTKLSFPELEEQQKIAAFFTALDKKIKLVEDKLSKTHLLFEALVEKVLDEKLTFSDAICGSLPWQKIVLKDICKKISYGINAPAGEYNECWKYIRITDIDDRTHKFTQPSPVSADVDHDQKLLTKYKVRTGDLLFARTGASVGKSYHYDQRDGNLVFAGFLIRCSLDLNKCNSYFIYLQTLTKRYSNWVKENSMRSGQPGLNSEQYGNFELFLPSLGEQEKIASFFKTFDEKLCNLSLQLEVLKKQKQAFMQQMFV